MRVGTGSSIKIRDFPWLLDSLNPFIEIPPYEGHLETAPVDLFRFRTLINGMSMFLWNCLMKGIELRFCPFRYLFIKRRINLVRRGIIGGSIRLRVDITTFYFLSL